MISTGTADVNYLDTCDFSQKLTITIFKKLSNNWLRD